MLKKHGTNPFSMTLKEYQTRVDAWVRQFKEGYFPPEYIMLRLAEEAGELAREVNHCYGPKKKKPDEAHRKMGGEIADIIFTLICLANREGIILDDEFEKTMQKYDERDKERWTKKD